MFRGKILCAAGVVAGLFVGGCAGGDRPAPGHEQLDQAKMMEMYAKAAEPGPEHKQLAEFEGEWEAVTKSWQPDGTPCGTGSGTLKNEMILGGRYLEMKFDGKMQTPQGDMPYHGQGVIAYDKGKGKVVSTWMDDMSTGLMITEGNTHGDVCKGEGEYTDPITRKATRVRDVMTKIDDKHRTYELHTVGPDGKWFKMMEIAYTKK